MAHSREEFAKLLERRKELEPIAATLTIAAFRGDVFFGTDAAPAQVTSMYRRILQELERQEASERA